MKTTTSKAPCQPKAKSYPCLGIFPNGEIVLFTDISTGTRVKGNMSGKTLGHHSEGYRTNWKTYEDSICLEN